MYWIYTGIEKKKIQWSVVERKSNQWKYKTNTKAHQGMVKSTVNKISATIGSDLGKGGENSKVYIQMQD